MLLDDKNTGADASNSKLFVAFDQRILNHHFGDAAGCGTLAQKRRQLPDGLLIALCVNDHAAVGCVSHPTQSTQLQCLLPRRFSESDTLHLSADHRTHRYAPLGRINHASPLSPTRPSRRSGCSPQSRDSLQCSRRPRTSAATSMIMPHQNGGPLRQGFHFLSLHLSASSAQTIRQSAIKPWSLSSRWAGPQTSLLISFLGPSFSPRSERLAAVETAWLNPPSHLDCALALDGGSTRPPASVRDFSEGKVEPRHLLSSNQSSKSNH